MTLRQKQSKFAFMVTSLIQYAYIRGYEVTLGDASRMDRRGHIRNSRHYKRLAIDLNLFFNGVYLTKTEDHLFLGQFWESIGGRWGGRFSKPDGNHYEYAD